VFALYQNFFPFQGGIVLGQLIFTAAMLSTVLFVSANLYLMEANSNSSDEKEDTESQQPWQKFGGLFYKSSRYAVLYIVLLIMFSLLQKKNVAMLLYVFAIISLSFGWALQTLITVTVASIVPSGKTGQRPWVVFVVLSIISTAVFFGGRSLYIKYVQSSRRDDDSTTVSNNESLGPVSATLTTNIKESLV
jgi:hypothetical protein